MTHELRMTRARTKLLLDQPWFGSLAMRLAIVADDTINPPTMNVDGVTLRYHSTFVGGLTDPELIGVLAHEVMHCALLHMFRRGARDAEQWNVAADYAINQVIVDSGMVLPDGALLDKKFTGMSADQIYSLLPSNPQPKNGGGAGQATGQFSDAPSMGKPNKNGNGNGQADADSPSMSEHDWQIAAEQATAIARKAGKLPGDVDRQIKQTQATPTDWRTILREFVAATVPSDYSWTHPNRRHIANGVYLPGTVKDNIGQLVVAVDTSGSVDQKMLSAFADELSGMLTTARPEKLHVVYCDTCIQATEQFVPGDDVQLNARGGGGTLFQPVFDWTDKGRESGELSDIKALIYLTDLECGDRPVAPDYPVLWVTPLWVRHASPGFGEVVAVDMDR